MENIYTLNQPRVFQKPGTEYQPSNDIIDWPVGNSDYPELDPYSEDVGPQFYERQVSEQKKLLAIPALHSTPIVLLAKDSCGKRVRVSLRKKLALA